MLHLVFDIFPVENLRGRMGGVSGKNEFGVFRDDLQ